MDLFGLSFADLLPFIAIGFAAQLVDGAHAEEEIAIGQIAERKERRRRGQSRLHVLRGRVDRAKEDDRDRAPDAYFRRKARYGRRAWAGC